MVLPIPNYLANTDRSPPFLVSFTTHSSDSDRDTYHRVHGMLSQWRAYGGDEGVALVLDTSNVEELLRREYDLFHLWPCFLANVVYGKEDFGVDREFPTLSQYLKAYARHFIRGDNEAALQTVIDGISHVLPTAVGKYKHIAFHEEQECRIVIGVTPAALRDELLRAGDITDRAFKRILYRDGRYRTIPYIRLFEDLGDDLPIVRIIVGPSRNQAAHVETVTDLVGTRQIPVQASETPYIGSTSEQSNC